MRHLVRSATAIPLLATGALVGLLSGTANAAPTAPDSLYAPSALVLTVGDGESAQTAVPLRAVTLSCGPQSGGTHPAASAACDELATVGGNFAALGAADDERFCPMIYDPVVVTAAGVYDGRRVSYERTYGNACEMGAAGTAVFAF